MKTVEPYKVSLLWLAAGDYLGTVLEFHPLGTFELITDMISGGTFNLKAGQSTTEKNRNETGISRNNLYN